MDYDSLTDRVDSLLQSPGWVNVPGGLDKVSESSAGAAWALGKGTIFSCNLPCTGNWIPLDIQFTPLDFTTDDTSVYILGSNGLLVKNGNNSGEAVLIPSNLDIQQIFSTGSYIWGQGSKKWKLAKPGTTGNWIESPDTSGVKITSASMTALYGVDPSGKAVKSDETLQSGWKAIPQFKGVFTGILGDADQSALYGVDTQQQIHKCTDDSCVPVSTEGSLKSLSVKPKHLWMTTDNPGKLGNVYYKDDNINILSDTEPLDKERDEVVKEIEQEYQQTTWSTVMYKQLNILKSLFDRPSAEIPDPEPVRQQADDLERSIPVLVKMLLTLGIITLLYLFGGFLGPATHYIALGIVAVSFYVIYNGV